MTGVAVISLVGNIVIYNRFTTLRPLVTVGKTVITKRQYQDTLEEAAGKQVLSKMVFAELIRQAASQAGLMPTDTQVAARIAQERAKNPALYRDIRDDQLRADVTSLMALENLRMQNVTVTDDDIAAYYALHLSEFQKTRQTKAALVVTSSQADAKAAAHMLQESIEPAIIAEQPGFQAAGVDGYSLDMQTPGRQGILHSILQMKRGNIRIFPMGKQFLTVEVYTNPNTAPPLWQVKDQVSRLARLERSPTAETVLASLYHANKPTFEIEKYAVYFQDIDRITPAPPPVVPANPGP